MKRILKLFLALFGIFLIFLISFFIFYITITSDAELDDDKLNNSKAQIFVYDSQNNLILETSNQEKSHTVEIDRLPSYVIDAFVAKEDNRFYSHKGLDYVRIAKAIINNVKSLSYKEGASTISQQLIKNTHLSHQKTIKRKLIEFKLTKQLEDKYNKKEILEMYLNTIYFGHNCYGIADASQFYFSKEPYDLTLNETATLVGLLASPNNYSPFKNAEKCAQQRNLVLSIMKNKKYISQTTYLEEIQKPINTNRRDSINVNTFYLDRVFEELTDLNIDFYDLANGAIIKTFLNASIQQYLDNIEYEYDNAVIVKDNQNSSIIAYKSSLKDKISRQAASTFKPLLVYAPAINENLVLPDTIINDEQVNYNGYQPQNYDHKYHGNVSIHESIINSYNIPAVKTLSILGIEKMYDYANKLQIPLENDDKNLSCALGATKKGVNIEQLCNAYSTFSTSGEYNKGNYIREIYKEDGTIIYERQIKKQKVFKKSTVSLINRSLIDTTQNGTAKKIKIDGIEIASKTGTNGNKNGNLDAYALSYTNDYTIGVWLGDRNNKYVDINGSNQPCKITRNIYKKLYENNNATTLDVSSDIYSVFIDKIQYTKNGNIILAEDICPLLNKYQINIPTDANLPTSTYFSAPTIEKPQIYTSNKWIKIVLCKTDYYEYLIYRLDNDRQNLIFKGKWQKEIQDENLEPCQYIIIPYYHYNNKNYFGEKIIIKYNPSKQNTPIQNSPIKNFWNE